MIDDDDPGDRKRTGYDPDAFNDFERRGWSAGGKAGDYESFLAGVTARFVGPLLDAAGVRAGSSVLDVGCGPGFAAQAAKGRDATVVGLDLSGEMLSTAVQRCPDVEFRRGDAEALPFADDLFTSVVANFVVLHVGRPEAMAAEMVRVSEPGGRVAITAWDGPERNRLSGVLHDAITTAGAKPATPLVAGPPMARSDDEMLELLAGAGLLGVTGQRLALHHDVDDADALWAGLLASTVRMAALVASFSPEVRDDVRACFHEIVRAHEIPGAGGRLTLPVSVLLMSGSVA